MSPDIGVLELFASSSLMVNWLTVDCRAHDWEGAYKGESFSHHHVRSSAPMPQQRSVLLARLQCPSHWSS